MKTFTFFPGFIVALVFTLLLTATKIFGLDIPLLKNLKNPLIALLIAGLMMCAFGTLANTVVGLIKEPHMDWFFALSVIVGILILVAGAQAVFTDHKLLGMVSKSSGYYLIGSLIVVKIALSTLRLMRLS